VEEIKRYKKIYKGYYNSRALVAHPYINLQGKLLEKYGFKIGEQIEISYSLNKIEIIKAE
jgi:hypothetical protein